MSDEKIPQEESQRANSAQDQKTSNNSSDSVSSEHPTPEDAGNEAVLSSEIQETPDLTQSPAAQHTSDPVSDAEQNLDESIIIPTDRPAITDQDEAQQYGEAEAVISENDSPDIAVEETDDLLQEEEDEEEIESSEDEEEDHKAEKSQKDYSHLSKKELLEEFKRLLLHNKIQDIKDEVEEIRSEFNAQFNEEMEQKREDFMADGGNLIDFHYSTPLRKEFNSLFFDYKEKRNAYYKNLKKNLQANLDKRWELIEELKGLLSAEENINTTYKHFKEIQEKWHTAGPIPRDKYNTVWNTYHHHVENFYDFLHLNREFRDLDFKYNLEAKLKLISRAEELAQEEDVNRAFRELQMLHKTWKEDIGPVAKEYRDDVWDKFSAATKVIHDKRQAHLDELEQEFQENLEKKKALIEEIAAFNSKGINSHKGWQSAIQKVQQLRDQFFEIGRVPRSKNKEIWKAFKDVTRNFNHSKNSFYKNQKKEQLANLEKKRELIAIAEQNKDSEDFEVVTPLMKKIQDDWKKIGHVPRRDSDKIWKEFKAACNYYFDRLHASKNKASDEEIENHQKKELILKELSEIELSGDHKTDLANIKKHISAWKAIGRVPANQKSIEQRFNKVLDSLFTKLDLGKKEKELIKFDNKLNTLVNRDDQRQLQNEHFYLSKKIEETQDEIRQLENNLGFFHNVDENNPLVKEVHKNIAQHKEQLEVLKAKLSKIREVRE